MKIYTMDDLLNDHFEGKQIIPFMTLREMGKRWGKSRFDVYNWSRRDAEFPKPVEGVVKGMPNKERIYPFYEVKHYEEFREIEVVEDITKKEIETNERVDRAEETT